ncbi:MAG: hypothetical protein IJ437_00370 [Clostridia bacterium]|nr:hypothetical protein [Clostridia bacterium]
MKKKIFLTLAIVMVLTCLFAIAVSATRVENYEDTFTLVNSSMIQHYERHYYNETQYHKKYYTDTITVEFIDEDGNNLTTVPMWEYDVEEGRYYSLVWYISAFEFGKETATTVISDVEYTYDKYTSAVYTLSKVRAVDIRYDHTYTESWSFSTSSVGYDYNYKVEKPLWGMFLDVNNTPDNNDDDYVLQASRGTGRDTSDYGYIGWDAQFAAQGNKIVVANFRDCDFDADCTGNYGTKNTWSLATNLQCLWYPDTVKYLCGGINSVYEIDLGDGIEVIACQILRDNKRVKEFVIPNSVLFLGNEAFRGSDLTKLTIGEGLITCPDNNAFLYTGGADYIYIPKNILNTYVGNISSLVANHNATIYFDGNLEDATALMAKIIEKDSGYNNKITLVDYNETQARGDIKNICLFYNYNRCDAFYRGSHDLISESGNTCSGTCSRCAKYELLPNPVHTEELKLVFGEEKLATVDFYANMSVLHLCKYCTTELADAEAFKPIFVKMGFSVSEADTTAISFNVAVNYDSLEKYEDVAKTTVKYGLLVSAVPTSSPITGIVDGKPQLASSTINIAMQGTTYTKFSVKITGIPTNQTLNCCGYVVEGENVTYLNHATADAEAATVSHAIALQLQQASADAQE